MAQPEPAPTSTFLERVKSRLGLARVAPAAAPSGPKSLLPVPLEQRVTGNPAGLPQGIVDNDRVATGAIPLRGEAPTEYQRSGATVRIRGFEQHPVVQACIRVVVDIASQVPLQVYKKKPSAAAAFTDEITVLGSNNDLQKLVDAPNTFLSAQRWRKFLFAHHMVYGNAFNYLERPPVAPTSAYTPPPKSLRVIRPEDILTVYVNVKGYPLWYLWRDVLGYTHTSPVQDIVHVRDLSIYSFVFGYPRGAAALNDIIGDAEASQFVRQTVTNSGQAGVWLIANDETTPRDAKIVEDQLYEQFVTRGQRGRLKVLGGIKDVKTVAFSLRDLEFPDLRMIAREDICAAFGVDPRMIGLASATKDGGLSGVQYEEARRRLVKHTIQPLMSDIESELNLWLAPEFGDVWLRFDPDALAQLTEDKQATSTRVLAEVAANVRTIEEAREAIELPPEFDNDDLLAGTTIVTPVLVAIQPPVEYELNPDGTPKLDENGQPIPKATPAAGTPGKGDVPADDAADPASDKGNQAKAGAGSTEKDLQADAGTDPNSPGRQPPKNGDADPDPKKRAGRAWPGTLPMQRVLARSVMLTEAQKVNLWRQFDARATQDEAQYRRTALVLFGEERGHVGRVMSEAEAKAGATEPGSQAQLEALAIADKEIRRFYRPAGPARERWQDRFNPLIAGTYGRGAAQVIASLKAARSEWGASFRAKPKDKYGTLPADAPVDFDLANPEVEVAIKARAKRLAEHVGKTTAQAVTDALTIGRKEGMGISEIARLIDRTAFGAGAGSRSIMIARTETVGALNQGEFDTAGGSGAVAGKEWLTQGDDRVRESHMECEREGVILLDDTFRTNGMRYPGDASGDASDVINCRCTLLYYDAAPDDRSLASSLATLEQDVASRIGALERSVQTDLGAVRTSVDRVAGDLRTLADRPLPEVPAPIAAPPPVINVAVTIPESPARGPVRSTRQPDGSVITEPVPPPSGHPSP